MYNQRMKIPKLGAHVSVAGGLSEGALRAVDMGAECIQIFAGSPRRYDVPAVKSDEVEKFKKIISENKIGPIFIHASYLLNLASEDRSLKEKSIKSLLDSLRFADIIGARGVIYHPGSPKGGDKEKAIERETQTVKEILELFNGDAFLIIENTAGKKKIGVSPEEISLILKGTDGTRVKVCIDTAHSLESGNIKKFSLKEIERWVADWEDKVGIDNIVALHINDSKTDYMSRHDRHANIGEGFIGKSGFSNLVKSGHFFNIPWILEVPGFDGKGPDKKNINILKSLFDF